MAFQVVAVTPEYSGSISDAGDPARAMMVVAVSALPRCNFAGFCNFCGEQGCRSQDCIAIYLDTWWAACDVCGGVGGDGFGSGCICTYGVIQVGPERLGAVQPIEQ